MIVMFHSIKMLASWHRGAIKAIFVIKTAVIIDFVDAALFINIIIIKDYYLRITPKSLIEKEKAIVWQRV